MVENMNTPADTLDLSRKLRECASQVGGGNELARKTGIPRRTLENYLQGNTEPGPSRLTAIAAAAGADIFWLIAGSGPFRPAGTAQAESAPPAYEDRLEKMRQISATLREAVEHERVPVDRQLWTDLQGLAYIHNLSHEAIAPIVKLIIRAFRQGAASDGGSRSDTGT